MVEINKRGSEMIENQPKMTETDEQSKGSDQKLTEKDQKSVRTDRKYQKAGEMKWTVSNNQPEHKKIPGNQYQYSGLAR